MISGSLRRRSTNSAVIRTGHWQRCPGVVTTVYEDLADLPHFNPDDDVDPLPNAVVAFRSLIRNTDAVLFSTPEYAGDLPGSFLNLLDWAVGDDQVGSLYEKPVAWINASPRGAADAHQSLRRVLGYLHATIVEEAVACLPITANDLGDDELIASTQIAAGIAETLAALARFVRGRDGGVEMLVTKKPVLKQ
jgi:chromate reductase